MKIIIINGSGGSGKDTVVELTSSFLEDKYEIKNISTIDEVKKIASHMGWNGEKNEKGRQFLADLKTAWTNYNNGANVEVYEKILNYQSYNLNNKKELLIFIHCREPESINWFIKKFSNEEIPVVSLFIKRAGIEKFFNEADKNVENFNYDTVLLNHNNLDNLRLLCKDLSIFIKNWDLKDKIIV